MPAPDLTLEDLVRQSTAALARLGQDNGQVQGVPDVRMVRYYASLALIDRPAAWRGRTALYGRRHLLQLTTIKRLQARGLTLVRVQELMLGAADARLRELAGLAAEDLAAEPIDQAGARTATPRESVRSPERRGSIADTTAAKDAAAPQPRRSDFWAIPAAVPTSALPPADLPPPRPRLRIDLPGGASLDLPVDRLDADAWRELGESLRPLHDWLTRHHPLPPSTP